MKEQIDLQSYQNLLEKALAVVFFPSRNLKNEKRGYLWLVLQRMLDQNSGIRTEVLDKIALATKQEARLVKKAIRKYSQKGI